MARTSNNRFSSLDALRGIAALLVVWQHTSEYFVQHFGAHASDIEIYEAIRAFDPGRIGVICFFLISGFIIPSSLRAQGEAQLSKFGIKRFFRLYPAYWLSIALAVLIDTTLLAKEYSLGQIGANLTMAQNILGAAHIQGLYWTLQVELFFYILCATLFAFKALQNQKIIFYTLAFSLAFFFISNLIANKLHLTTNANKELLYTPYLLGVMLCGTLLRNWLDLKDFRSKRLMLSGFFLVFSIPLANMALSLLGVKLIGDPARFLLSHTTGLIIFVIGIQLWKSPSAIFLRLGVISYSIYLFHPIIMHLMYGLTKNGMISDFVPQNIWLQVALATLLVCSLAEATYRLIEEPFNDIAKRLCQSIRTPGVTPSR